MEKSLTFKSAPLHTDGRSTVLAFREETEPVLERTKGDIEALVGTLGR